MTIHDPYTGFPVRLTWRSIVLCLAVTGSFLYLGLFSCACGPGAAEVARASADLLCLQTNLVRFRTIVGRWPSQAEGLMILAEKPGTDAPEHWRKLCDPGALVDPWGQPYRYLNPGRKDSAGFDVFSLGADGMEGTEDDVYPEPKNASPFK